MNIKRINHRRRRRRRRRLERAQQLYYNIGRQWCGARPGGDAISLMKIGRVRATAIPKIMYIIIIIIITVRYGQFHKKLWSFILCVPNLVFARTA